MIISALSNKFDRAPRSVPCEFEDLAAAFTRPDAHLRRTEKDGPLFSPCEFDGTGKGAESAVRVWFGVLDLDSLDATALTALLQKADRFDAFAYSTHSHSAEKPKARLCIRWSRPASASEYAAVWRALAADFPGSDAQCKDAGRFYYLPSAPEGAQAAAWRSSGREAWDVDAVRAPEAAPDPGAHDTLHVGALLRWAKRARNSKAAEARAIGEIAVAGLSGHAMAPDKGGTRDATLFRLACSLASEFPTTDPQALAAEFEPSCSHWTDCARDPVLNLREKIERKQREVRAARGTAGEALSGRQTENLAIALRRRHPYTPEELAEYSAAHALPLSRRWLVALDDSVWAQIDGSYVGPWRGLAAGPAVAQALAPASSAGVSLYAYDAKGNLALRQTSDLVQSYGVALDDVEADLTAKRAVLDPVRRVLVQAPCPLRDLEPEYNPEIAEWLELLAPGTKHESLLNWLAAVTRLEVAAPALYLYGASGAGKNLLAYGLARLWSSSPSSLAAALDGFNDDLLRCPLVYGDERIPDRNGVPRTEELRELVTRQEHSINRKHVRRFVAKGACRVVLSANKPNLTARNAELSADDVKALGDRLVSVKVPAAAADWLAQRGGVAFTASWVRDSGIAQHALWLRETRAAVPGTRLAVPSDSAELVAALRVGSGLRWQTLYWICSWLRDPAVHARATTGREPAALLDAGGLWVSYARLAESWTHYLPGERQPSVERVAHAIQDMAREQRAGGVVRYGRLDFTALVSWCDGAGEPVPSLEQTAKALCAVMN